MMSIGLNTATLAEKDPRKQIAIAKDAGFSAIGLWISDLGWDADDEYLQEIAMLAWQAGLGINELDFLKAATSAERSFEKVLGECTRMAHVARVLGCPVIVAAPAGAGEEDLSLEQYRQLMACGKKEDVVVSLEFSVTAKTYSTLESVLPLVDSTDIPLDGCAIAISSTLPSARGAARGGHDSYQFTAEKKLILEYSRGKGL